MARGGFGVDSGERIQQAINALRRHPPVQFSVEQYRRAARAIAKAINRLQGDCAVVGRLVLIDLQALADMSLHGTRADRLAGFSAT